MTHEISHLFSVLPRMMPHGMPAEMTEILIQSETVRIERIVSAGHVTPAGQWYDQEEHEWVVVLQGEGKIQFEGEADEVTLKPGDHLLIAAHQKHRVVATTTEPPTIWLAVFYR